MRRTILPVLVLASAATWARAQLAPVVEVTPILKEKRPHILPAQVAAGNCYSTLSGVQREEMAEVKVTIRGPWERSAQHLAAEKAAELGANCLHLVSSSGEDNSEYPVVRSYKALRVTIPYGPWRVPASRESLASPAASLGGTDVGFPLLELKTPVSERKPSIHGDHLGRAMGDAVYFHEIVLAPARSTPAAWSDVEQDVREYFDAAEEQNLSRLAATGKAVRIDLKVGTVSGQRAEGR